MYETRPALYIPRLARVATARLVALRAVTRKTPGGRPSGEAGHD